MIWSILRSRQSTQEVTFENANKVERKGKSFKFWCIFVADISSEIQTKRELCFVESVFK